MKIFKSKKKQTFMMIYFDDDISHRLFVYPAGGSFTS